MNISRSIRVAALGVCATLCSTLAFAQIDARMFRQPAVSKDQIVAVSDELTLTLVGIRGPGSGVRSDLGSRTTGLCGEVSTPRTRHPESSTASALRLRRMRQRDGESNGHVRRHGDSEMNRSTA
jgi:hypothetical protein